MRLSQTTTALLAGGVTFLVLAGGWRVARVFQKAPTPSTSPTASLLALPTPPPFPTPAELPAAETLVRPDRDADGLPDNLEPLYRTDPSNPDTDGDGYRDGHEVVNGYDPAKPSPGDKLAASLPSPAPALTLTEEFLARTGARTDPRTLLQSEALQDFVEETRARVPLREIPDRILNRVSASGKEAIARYLDAVSVPQNTRMVPVTVEEISAAFTALTKEKNDQPLKALVANLTTNVQELARAPVPAEALALHKQYVAASTALKESTETLLNYQADYVGSLVAASRIESLRTVFQTVLDGIKALEKKYAIE